MMGNDLNGMEVLSVLKIFVEQNVVLRGKWVSLGGCSKKFLCYDSDLTLTWYPGKQNSLILHGDSNSILSKAMIEICREAYNAGTEGSACLADGKSTNNSSGSVVSPLTSNTNNMDDLVAVYGNIASEVDQRESTIDIRKEECTCKVRSDPTYQILSSSHRCDCGCRLLAADLEGVKLEMAIMQRNIESKTFSAGLPQDNEKIKQLEQDLANERDKCRKLEGDISVLIRGRNAEIN